MRDGLQVRRRAAIQLQRDKARHGERLERVDLAEPRLEQRGRFLDGKRPHIRDAGLAAEKRRDLQHDLLGVDLILGLDLDRHLAGDVLEPGVGRLPDHVDGAGRQAGQEAHDRDHERERLARDRSCRHDRRGRLGAAALRVARVGA